MSDVYVAVLNYTQGGSCPIFVGEMDRVISECRVFVENQTTTWEDYSDTVSDPDIVLALYCDGFRAKTIIVTRMSLLQ